MSPSPNPGGPIARSGANRDVSGAGYCAAGFGVAALLLSVEGEEGVAAMNAPAGTDAGDAEAFDVAAGVPGGVTGIGGADAAVTGPSTGGTCAVPDLLLIGAGVGVGGGADAVV